MEDYLTLDFTDKTAVEEILIQQRMDVIGKKYTAQGKIYFNQFAYFVELCEESDTSPFMTQVWPNHFNSSFKAIFKFKHFPKENFELTLLPNPELNDFEVIEDHNFQLLALFLKKENLEHALPTKEDKTSKPNKI